MANFNHLADSPNGHKEEKLNFQELMENVPCGIIRCLYDEKLTLTYMNDVFLSMTGYTKEEIAEQFNNSLKALILPEDFEHIMPKVTRQLRSGNSKEIDYRLICKNGKTIWIMDMGELVHHSKGPGEFFCILIDISTQKQGMLSLMERAERDPLTGLYNSMTAQSLIEEYLDTLEKNDNVKSTTSALVLVDIDDFKQVNDTFGHIFADTVLIDLAGLLKKSFRSSDIIGRAGGDEMMIFMKNVPSEDFVQNKLEEVLESLSSFSAKKMTVENENGEFSLSCSAGAAIYPKDGGSFKNLYRNADAALYQAKKNGKGRVILFDKGTSSNGHSSPTPLTKIDSEKRVKAGQNVKLIEYAFNLLYESENLFDAITLLFAMIGQQFDISRVYVAEASEDNEYLSRTIEWCAEDVASQKEKYQNTPVERFKWFYDNMGENGFLYCRDVAKLPDSYKDEYQKEGIKSMLMSVLEEDGRVYGIVGFDECQESGYWNSQQIDVLNELARIVGIFLSKHRLQQKLKKL